MAKKSNWKKYGRNSVYEKMLTQKRDYRRLGTLRILERDGEHAREISDREKRMEAARILEPGEVIARLKARKKTLV